MLGDHDRGDSYRDVPVMPAVVGTSQEGRMTQQTLSRASVAAARRFVDCVGVHWTVYCIAPPTLLHGVTSLRPHPERRQGWLLFESEDGERRRLSPYPPDWRIVSAFELERWCMRAALNGLTPRRRAEDSDSS
jgi:hypothetical protein